LAALAADGDLRLLLDKEQLLRQERELREELENLDDASL
jgi:hypothetical protein